jgi:hypothetical protein
MPRLPSQKILEEEVLQLEGVPETEDLSWRDLLRLYQYQPLLRSAVATVEEK